MKRVRVYKEIISDENLRLAIREVNAGHRRNGNHSLNKKVIEIENNMDEYVEKLRAFIQGLVDGDEHMHPPLKRRRWDRNADSGKGKWRDIRPRLPSALGYRFGHGYTILRKHNLFRLKQSLHLYYYRRDRNRVISFKRASGLISRLGQLRKCNHQQVLDRHYQPKTMFALKKVVRKECRRLQALYPPYQAA